MIGTAIGNGRGQASLDALDAAKRRAYTVGLGVAIPMDLFGVSVMAEPIRAVVLAQLGAVGLYAVLLACLLRRRMPLHTFERIAYAALALAYVVRVAAVMFTLTTESGAAIGLMTSYIGVIVLYVLAFAAFDKARARLLATLMVLATTAVTALGMIGKPAVIVEGVAMVAPWLLGLHVIIIVLLYVLASAKEKMAYSLAMAEAMATVAATDPLTGVANRRELSSVVEAMIEQRLRYGGPLSLVLIDVDHFKRVNDSLGHAAGDEVLKEVCRRLQGELRATDTLGRWGGEEFLVVAPSTDGVEAVSLAGRCGDALRATPIGKAGTITASFGVATHQGDESADNLLLRTDEALYEAKHRGRDRVAAAPQLDNLPG
jgi:diguanylate cyclase (GGDEF)-like protein